MDKEIILSCTTTRALPIRQVSRRFARASSSGHAPSLASPPAVYKDWSSTELIVVEFVKRENVDEIGSPDTVSRTTRWWTTTTLLLFSVFVLLFLGLLGLVILIGDRARGLWYQMWDGPHLVVHWRSLEQRKRECTCVYFALRSTYNFSASFPFIQRVQTLTENEKTGHDLGHEHRHPISPHSSTSCHRDRCIVPSHDQVKAPRDSN